MTEPPRTLVFAGPSLPPDAARRWPNVAFRAPAVAGDVIALLDEPPAIALLIDGCFDAVGAVRHKELMLLAAAGCRVLGAASMGALRAAELDRHGMAGVGHIFAAFRSGRLTGDDEVALIHAPAALGFRPLTVAMVDLRAALAQGCRQGSWSVSRARATRAALHDVHFTDRDIVCVAQVAARHGIYAPALVGMATGTASLKRRDAEAALAIVSRPSSPLPNQRLSVARTCFVERLAAERGVRL